MKTLKAFLTAAFSTSIPVRLGAAYVAAISLVAFVCHPIDAPAVEPRTCPEFSELSIGLERNATDGDTEVVIFVKGQDAGLKQLVVTGPNGKKVAAFYSSGRGIGIREFVLESAEPPDLDAVLRSFPEGQYTISGRTVDGQCLEGTTLLSHQIAPATTLLTPAEEQVVPLDQVVLSWEPVANAERYIVELNNENTGSEFTFQIFAPTTSLAIPAHFLVPGSEYQFGVGVRTTHGNITFVERTFFTSP